MVTVFTTVSIWLTENESLHVDLRMLTAIELYENTAFYVQHPGVLSVQSSLKVGEDTLFKQILSSNGTTSMNENTSVMTSSNSRPLSKMRQLEHVN